MTDVIIFIIKLLRLFYFWCNSDSYIWAEVFFFQLPPWDRKEYMYVWLRKWKLFFMCENRSKWVKWLNSWQPPSLCSSLSVETVLRDQGSATANNWKFFIELNYILTTARVAIYILYICQKKLCTGKNKRWKDRGTEADNKWHDKFFQHL